jgi:hypothetical protein
LELLRELSVVIPLTHTLFMPYDEAAWRNN